MDKAGLLLLVFYNILSILRVCCASNDTINPTQPLKVGQTLISARQIFELGFFSPGNNSALYIGIWYKIDPGHRIVWVANRENALLASDRASRLVISSDGNLNLIDGKQNTVWSTNASIHYNNTIAVLTDDGDFILRDNFSGASLWESFYYPSGTVLPNMAGAKNFSTAWENEDDPAFGKFFSTLSDEKPPQPFTCNGTKPYWRGGPWNGWQFIGIPDATKGYANGMSLIPNNHNGAPSFTFSTFNESYIYIMVILPTGTLQLLSLEGQQKQWNVFWAAPQNPCDVYGTCGPFSACSMSGSPICECLKGFFPQSNEEWSKGNWTSGCMRGTELMCAGNSSNLTFKPSKPDGFWKLSQMKLPDHYLYLYDQNDQGGCSQWCLSNCSCQAYAYPDGIGCMVWVTDLVDVQQFSDGGEDLYLRLANSELGPKKLHRAIIMSVLSISVGLLMGLLICCIKRWKTNRRVAALRHSDTHLPEQKSKWRIRKGFRIKRIVKGLFVSEKKGTVRDISQEDIQEVPASAKGSSELPIIDFNRVKLAANNFSDANKLGEGGFGTVYMGKLEDGQQIAVKRLSSHSGQGMEEFKNEVTLISKLQHRNLVRLLGCCIQGEEKIVILEYMKNKSLDKFLFDRTKRLELDWAKRFNIIQGIARGLLYLHRDSSLRIIHRDLKASNILLDDEMNPKISDFGLARTFRVTQELANTRRVVGTFGYMSPEYAMGGLFSEKSDVYSFGVLLLEIVSSKKSTGFGYHEKYLNLLGYAWQLWNECKAPELLEPSLADSCTPAEVMRCIQIGLLCVQDHAADRPTMSNVVLMLGSSESEMELPQPRQPTFTFQSLLESQQFQSGLCMCNVSINRVSISTVEGR